MLCAVVLIFSGVSSLAVGQDTEPAAETEVVEESNEAPEAPKKVDVQPIAHDEEIAQRLEDILAATEWFSEPSVEVQDGVVFLKGVAAKENYRSWATDLAQNTQDVAAVVNRMSILEKSIWDLSPAVAELRSLSATAIQLTPLLLIGFVIIVLTWVLARAVKRLASWFFQKRISNPLLRRVVSQATMLPILLMGTFIVLQVLGLTRLAMTVLGGTGLAGLIIGIAFRDIAENFLASILISVQNPFRSGDLVQVGEHVGFVQMVTTRGTLLMTFDGNHVQIPNATIYKSTVTNFSANPNRRVEFVVGIGYDDSITKAQEVVKSVLDRHPNVLNDPESRVILDELGASTVNLRVFVWLDALKHSPDSVRSSVMRMVKQALLQAGISLPDEAREVIFPNNVPVRMISEDSTSKEQSIQVSPQPTEQATKPSEPIEEVHSVGEGNHSSDSEEIQRQADSSWSPEQGTNLLAEDEDLAPTN